MDPSVDTEIALLKQAYSSLVTEIRVVDANCDKRSDATDGKLDRLQWWMLTTMASIAVTLAVILLSGR